jgi:hypothetical protein
MAVAARSVDHEAGVARCAVRALACEGGGGAPADSTATGNRHFSRAGVARCGAISHIRRAAAWSARAAGAFAFSGIECTHLCGVRRETGGVVFQSGCGKYFGGVGRARGVSSAVFFGGDEVRRACRMDSLCQRTQASWRDGCITEGAISRGWAGVCRAAREHGTFSGGAILPVHIGQTRADHSLRDSSSAVALAIGGGVVSGKQHACCRRNCHSWCKAGITAFFASAGCGGVGAAISRLEIKRLRLENRGRGAQNLLSRSPVHTG